MPMLLDDEWRAMHDRIAQHVERWNAEHEEVEGQRPPDSIRERSAKLVEEYNSLTGAKETNPNAVWHHLRSLYGPPCQYCGKVLRTSQASFCFLCHREQGGKPTS